MKAIGKLQFAAFFFFFKWEVGALVFHCVVGKLPCFPPTETFTPAPTLKGSLRRPVNWVDLSLLL